jgi:hypothetical protein
LLDHLFEAKVAGFGPKPEEQLGINVNPIHVSNNIKIKLNPSNLSSS